MTRARRRPRAPSGPRAAPPARTRRPASASAPTRPAPASRRTRPGRSRRPRAAAPPRPPSARGRRRARRRRAAGWRRRTAAFSALTGTRSTSHCDQPGSCRADSAALRPAPAALARRLSATAGSMLQLSEQRVGQRRAEDRRGRRRRRRTARAPARPAGRRRARRASTPHPTIRPDAMSGITVIRIALTNRRPSGSTTAGSRCHHPGPAADTPMPAARPATRPMITRRVNDIAVPYRISSRTPMPTSSVPVSASSTRRTRGRAIRSASTPSATA